MTDRRELILARLATVIEGVSGIAKAGRNRPDVTGKSRPAAILNDGAEAAGDNKGTLPRNSALSLIEMSPTIAILHGAASEVVGTEVNALRVKLLKAIFGDAELIALIGGVGRSGNGEIRYEGCSLETESGETREARMEISLTITYVFSISDL